MKTASCQSGAWKSGFWRLVRLPARRAIWRGAISNPANCATAYKLKGPQDYWTAADGEVEKLIVGRLSEAFPEDTFFGEEGGGSFSPEVWVIDPIDGTANFARGIPHFCISIAFLREGRMTIGVIYDPMRRELFATLSGGGATCNGRPMRVSTLSDIRSATVELGWSMRRPMKHYVELIGQLTATGAGFRRAGSGALGLAYVADGRCEGYCELHINSWDALAGLLLVAGGRRLDQRFPRQ